MFRTMMHQLFLTVVPNAIGLIVLSSIIAVFCIATMIATRTITYHNIRRFLPESQQEEWDLLKCEIKELKLEIKHLKAENTGLNAQNKHFHTKIRDALYALTAREEA